MNSDPFTKSQIWKRVS